MFKVKMLFPVMGLILFAAVPLTAAGEEAQQKSVFRVDEQGLIYTEAGVFGSFAEYFRSDYFRLSGRRCLVKPAPYSPGLDERLRVSSDCTDNQTVIRSEYWPQNTLSMKIVFHVIQNSSGRGAVSDNQIRSQVAVLNEDFGALSGTLGERGFNTRLNFVLAGITRSVNDSWFNDRDEMAYKRALAWDPNRYINIYTNSAGGYLGYSYTPQLNAGEIHDGVVMLYEVVGGRDSGVDVYDQGRTLVHELGHYFGLLHTFEEGCTNSYRSGDLIVDTPAEAEEHYDCIETHTCGSADPIHNYMNYTPDSCMNRFTREQANRMVCSIMTYRSGLFVSLLPPKNLAAQRLANNLVLFTEYINRLSWQRNEASPIPAVAYRIYRKAQGEADDAYIQLTELSADTLIFEDRGLRGDQRLIYRVTALSQSGLESVPVTVEAFTD